MHKKLISKLILLWFTAGLLSSTTAQENFAIRKIIFKGNDEISTSKLKSHSVLEDYAGLERLLFWREPYPFSEEMMNRDIQSFKRLYQTQGFLKTQITSEFKLNQKKQMIDITYNISEGPPVIIDSILINIINDTSSTDSMSNKTRKTLQPKHLQQGMRFRDELLVKDRERMLEVLVDAGFAYANINNSFKLHSDSTKVDITYFIQPGPLCYFGKVDIKGNKAVPASAIKKQIAVKKGQTFSENKIAKSQRQIYNLALFQYVSVQASLDQPENRTLPVNVLVKESPRWTTKLGLGYGREDKFRSFVELQKLGFISKISRINVYLKHSALEPYRINIKWTRPAFLDPNASLALNPFYRRQKEPGYQATRYGGSVAYQRTLRENLNGSVSHVIEQVNLDASKIEPAEPVNVARSLYNKSVTHLYLGFDNSNPPFSPTSGIITGFNFSYAGFGRSDYQYIKMNGEIRNYQHLGLQWVVASRLKMGVITPVQGQNSTPIEERYFAGGSNSIRGWARADLGPKNVQGKPTGGNSLIEASLELRFPIYKWLSGVVFWDVGNVWTTEYSYKLDDVEHAVGIGLRISTPIGPVRLDVCEPVSMPDKPLQFYLSVGHAF